MKVIMRFFDIREKRGKLGDKIFGLFSRVAVVPLPEGTLGGIGFHVELMDVCIG